MSEERAHVDTDQVRELLREFARPLIGWLLVAVGIGLLVAGWFGVSREALVARQLPYFLSGGLGGLAAVLVGVVLVAAHDLRRFSGRLRRLEDQLADLHEVLLVEPSGIGLSGNGSASGKVVVLPDGERFHAPSCPVVQGKDGVREVERHAARTEGLTPCKLCHEVTETTEGAEEEASTAGTT